MWEDLYDIDGKKQKPPEHFDIAEPPTEAVADAEELRKDLETLEDIKKRFDLEFPEIDKTIVDKKKLLEEMAPETTSASLLRKSKQAKAAAKQADERLEKFPGKDFAAATRGPTSGKGVGGERKARIQSKTCRSRQPVRQTNTGGKGEDRGESTQRGKGEGGCCREK